jgi:4-hydroxybenzoate polyprenyltransferase
MKFLESFERIIDNIENSESPFFYFIFTFFSAITLRNFLETFSTGIPISLPLFAHYDFSYVYLALALIILFHIITKEKIEKIAKIILPCFLILIIVPIIDLAVSGGEGYKISYILPGIDKDVALKFFTFFGPNFKKGITPGIRIEVALVLFGSFIYFYIKKKKIIQGLLFSFLVYCLIFSYLAIPFILKAFLELFNFKYMGSAIFINFYFLLIFILLAWIFFLYKRQYFMAIIRDIRLFRLLHFEIMFFLGIILGVLSGEPVPFLLDPTPYLFNRIFIMISVLFAWIFSLITNNLADCEIDKVTNSERPLVAGKIPEKDYKILALIFLILLLVFAGAVNFETLFLMLLFIGNYFLYSMPPLRLKRIPFFSKLLISLNSLILVLLGYFFITKNFGIPKNIIFFFTIFYTAPLNFIDIKDYEGDKKHDIKTLPVIFGLEKSKRIIGFFFFISYLAVWFIIKDVVLIPFLFLIGLFQFFLINRRNYKEEPIFIVYFLTIFLLFIYLNKFISIRIIGS